MHKRVLEPLPCSAWREALLRIVAFIVKFASAPQQTRRASKVQSVLFAMATGGILVDYLGACYRLREFAGL